MRAEHKEIGVPFVRRGQDFAHRVAGAHDLQWCCAVGHVRCGCIECLLAELLEFFAQAVCRYSCFLRDQEPGVHHIYKRYRGLQLRGERGALFEGSGRGRTLVQCDHYSIEAHRHRPGERVVAEKYSIRKLADRIQLTSASLCLAARRLASILRGHRDGVRFRYTPSMELVT